MFRVSNPKPCSCERKGSCIILMKGKTRQCNRHIFAGENNGLFLCFADPVAAVKPNHVLRERPTIGVRVKKQKKRMDVLTCKDFLTKIWAISLCLWALQNEGEEKAPWWHAHFEIKMQFACSVWCTWSSLTTLQGSVWGASTVGVICRCWVPEPQLENLVWGHHQPIEVPRVRFSPSSRISSWVSWTCSFVSLPACYTFQKCCLYYTDLVYVE